MWLKRSKDRSSKMKKESLINNWPKKEKKKEKTFVNNRQYWKGIKSKGQYKSKLENGIFSEKKMKVLEVTLSISL